MNVCSLELSKQLFKLSGWDDTDIVEEYGTPESMSIAPRYSLDYLLRKLAPLSERNIKLYYSVTEEVWKCMFAGYGSPKYAIHPEDAACKLAISLFQQGILTRKGDK